MQCKRLTAWCVVTALGLWTLGCGGPSGPQPGHGLVSGTVTLPDGKPALHGSVDFYPDKSGTSKTATGCAVIIDGKYATASGKGPLVGVNRVEVLAFDRSATKIASSGVFEILGATEQKVTIKAGSQTLNFKLK